MGGTMDILGTKTVNLLLVDDHAMFRESLSQAIEKEPGFRLAGHFSSSAEAIGALRGSGATIVLLDANPGVERALGFVVEFRKRKFEGSILIVTAGISGQEAVQLMQAGVAGILHKHHSIDELFQVIRRIAFGEVYLEPVYLDSLYRSVDRTKNDGRAKLTERDKTVLRLLVQGMRTGKSPSASI